MRVVHVCSEIFGGGAARATQSLHDSLLALNIDSRILAEDAEQAEDRIHSLVRTAAVRDRRRNVVRRFLRKNRTSISTTHFSIDVMGMRIEEEAWIQNADIIHLHWVAETLSSASLAGLAKLGKRVVWTLHDMRPLTGGCHFPAGCQKFMDGCGSCPQLRADYYQTTARTLKAMEVAGESLQPHFVAPSSWMAEQVRTSRAGRNRGVSIIPNGVNTETFSPGVRGEARRQLGLPENGRMILLAGHSFVEKRKGLDQALQILSTLRQAEKGLARVATGEFSLLLAGGDSREVRPRGWKVRRVGRVPAERMPLLYQAADVLLFTSLEDNLPNVILEAMACGLPVVAHRVGGVEDLLGGAEPAGLLFYPQHSEEGTSGLLRIFDEPRLAEQLASRSLQRARNQFSIAHQAKNMVSLYQSLSSPCIGQASEGEEGAQILGNVPYWRYVWERWKRRLILH